MTIEDGRTRIAVYPGSFDPLTNGHVDIILRGAHIFDKIVLALLVNVDKNPLFSLEDRVEITRKVFQEYPNACLIDKRNRPQRQRVNLRRE